MGQYNYRQLTKKLQKLGYVMQRQGRGSHVIWGNKKQTISFAVPNHGGQDIRSGTIRSILKVIGMKNIHELDQV